MFMTPPTRKSSIRISPIRVRPVAAAAGIVLALGLSSCSSGSSESSEGSSASSSSNSAQAKPADQQKITTALEVKDPRIKTTKDGATAVFAMIKNTGTDPVTIVSAASPVTGTVMLHKTTKQGGAMKMQAKEGGFTIAGGKTRKLTPGGDHIMLMKLAKPITAGQKVPVTLKLKNGKTQAFTAIGRTLDGAKKK